MSILLRTPWFAVEALPQGEGREPYYRFVEPDGVLSFVLTEKGEIVMVSQERPAIGETTLELPAGGVGEGEDPLAAAAREMLEETGHACPVLRVVGTGVFRPDRSTSREFLVAGAGAIRQPGWQAEDGITVHLVPRAEFPALVADRRFIQLGALSILAAASLVHGIDLLYDPLDKILERLTEDPCAS